MNPRSRRSLTNRVGVGLALVLVYLLTPSAAHADPAEPTDYSSEIEAITPDPGTFTVEVLGGDSFLQVSVDAGTELIVLGYEDEPYLRFRPDGVVEVNRRSTASVLNDSRFLGDEAPPVRADNGPDTEWEQVATGGTYAWHDHRVHWMQLVTPVTTNDRGRALVQSWTVPLEVDGRPVEIAGSLFLESAPTPAIYFGIIAVIGGALWALLRRRGPLVLPPMAALGATLGLGVGAIEFWSMPPVVRDNPAVWLLPMVAIVFAMVGVVRRLPPVPMVAALASVAVTIGWGFLRIAVFSNAQLPTTLDPNIDRLLTTVSLGLAVGVGVCIATSGDLLPNFSPPPEPKQDTSPDAEVPGKGISLE